MSQATGQFLNPRRLPLIIGVAIAAVAGIVVAIFVFVSPSTEESPATEESTSVDPCLAEGNVFLESVDMEAIDGMERIEGVLHVSTQLMDEQDGCVDPWPLTTTSGQLTCFEEGTTITSPSTVGAFRIVWDTFAYTDVGDRPKWYALNDAAIAAAPFWDFLDIDPIRKDDPDGIDGSKVDLEPLLKLGLSLCENI